MHHQAAHKCSQYTDRKAQPQGDGLEHHSRQGAGTALRRGCQGEARGRTDPADVRAAPPRPRGGAREAGPPGGAATGQQGASAPRVTPRSPGRVLIDEDGCLCSARSSQARLGHRARPCLKQGKGPAAPRSSGARRRAGPHLRAARPPRASRLGLAHSCTEALAAVPFFQEG